MDNVFSPLNILAEAGMTASSSDIVTLDSITEKEGNYLTETLSFLSSLNEDYDIANRSFYRSILESDGNAVLIQEAAGSFFEGFKNLIRKFLSFIQSIFQKFITKLNSAVHSEKYLLKHKKEFKRFTSSDNFDINGYVYTFNGSVPLIDLTIAYDADFTGLTTIAPASYSKILDDKKLSTKLSDRESSMATDVSNKLTDYNRFTMAVKALHAELKDKIDDDSYYDIFRGKVLGQDGIRISDDDFGNECWKVYRNGEDSTEKIEINRTYIDLALKRIENYKDTIKKVEHLQQDIDKKYRKLEEKVDKMVKANKVTDVSSTNRSVTVAGYDGTDYETTISSDGLNELNAYIKTLTAIVQQMSSIHSMAFASKLDAIKDEYVQDKAALYTALSKCESAKKIRAAKGYSESAALDKETIGGGKLWIM